MKGTVYETESVEELKLQLCRIEKDSAQKKGMKNNS